MPWTGSESADEHVTQLGFESIGRLLQELRRQSGWTQQELQALSGVHQSVISRLENGKQRGLSWPRFGRLIGTLGGIELRTPPAIPFGQPIRVPASSAPTPEPPTYAADSHTE